MLAINHHKIIKNDNLEKKLAELRAKIRVAKVIGKRDAAAKYELELAELELEKCRLLQL
ncbi:hypothetical protein [Phascolarctobacterium sp.]|uniref:hypothetical protein n=1 Tax=Phascolarctobacterium sp. TaxID=2049039 RepID=UPI003867A17C